jgi:hypothetical protein
MASAFLQMETEGPQTEIEETFGLGDIKLNEKHTKFLDTYLEHFKAIPVTKVRSTGVAAAKKETKKDWVAANVLDNFLESYQSDFEGVNHDLLLKVCLSSLKNIFS